MSRSLLAVLVPARNAEADLPGFFHSVRGFADMVIALDDGSTDDTRRELEREPIVRRLLSNPERSTYEGWDDAANRRRLISAASRIEVDWLMFLDADERIDEADGRALRAFLETEAISGFAYGFQVFRMAEDDDHYDPSASLWVYRLFANEADQDLTLPAKRLHFVPVPVAIDRRRWLRTTVRIQHLGSLTAERRRRRFRKYEEADPAAEYQYGYEHLLDDPPEIRVWRIRSPDLPVLVDDETSLAEDELRYEHGPRPRISAVVIAQNDAETIGSSLAALEAQDIRDASEVILVTSGGDNTAELVRDRFPAVRVVDLRNPVLPGEARNHGLWMARGEYVSFPGSHLVVGKGYLSARADAHDAGHDLVSGAVVNGSGTRAGWASYFLDHSACLPGRPSGPMATAPSHASFVRDDLDAIGGFPEELRAGEDTVAIGAVYRIRRSAYFTARSNFIHTSPCRTPARLIKHHFVRGRAWGRILAQRAGGRLAVVAKRWQSLLRAPARRVRFVHANVAAFGTGVMQPYEQVRGLVALGAVSSALGTWYQLTVAPPARSKPPLVTRGASLGPPVLVCHYGSPISVHLGLAGRGTPATAAERVARHASGLSIHRPTVPSLNILATAATITPGRRGDHVARLTERTFDRYVAAAREVGVRLVIGLQPGLLSYSEAIVHYERYLAHDDVDVSLQPDYASDPGLEPQFGSQPLDLEQLEEAIDYLDSLSDRRHQPVRLLLQTTNPESARKAVASGAIVTTVFDAGGAFDDKVARCREESLVEGDWGIVSDLRADPEPVQSVHLGGVASPHVVVFR